MEQRPYDEYYEGDMYYNAQPPGQMPYQRDAVPPPPSRRNQLLNYLESPGFAMLWQRNRFTTIFVVLGLVIAVLFLSIGFFETLLILLLMGIGALVGGFLDGKPRIYYWIERFRR